MKRIQTLKRPSLVLLCKRSIFGQQINAEVGTCQRSSSSISEICYLSKPYEDCCQTMLAGAIVSMLVREVGLCGG